MRVKVSTQAEIPPGSRRIFEVDGRAIGVFNLAGSYYALSNVCTHQGGPVCNGQVLPRLTAEVLPDGEVREVLSPEPDIVVCPWHGWEFDVRTGECLANPRKSLPSYKVIEEDGDLYIEMGE